MVAYSSPFAGAVTSNAFGNNGHYGWDQVLRNAAGQNISLGQPVLAVADGVVIRKGHGVVMGYDYGYWIEYKADDGVYVFEAHMKSEAFPDVNERISRKERIGVVGASGKVTGAHLHTAFMTGNLVKSSSFDPQAYIARHAPTPAGNGGTPITSEEYDMTMKPIREPGGGIALVGETTYQTQTLAEWTINALIYGSFTSVTLAQFKFLIAQTQVRRAILAAGMPSGGGAASVNVDEIVSRVSANVENELVLLSDEIAKINDSLGFPDPDDIASAVDAALGDDFARLESKLNLVIAGQGDTGAANKFVAALRDAIDSAFPEDPATP